MKKIFLLPVIICSGLLAGCGGGQYVQPELGTRTVQVIEKNARLTPAEIAVMLGADAAEVENEIWGG